MLMGPRIAKAWVMDHLEQDLPSRIDAYRSYWDYDEIDLPKPQGYYTFDPQVTDYATVVFSVIDESAGFDPQGYDFNGRRYYINKYNVTVVVWAMGCSIEDVTDRRDDLLTVVRDSLVRAPGLTPEDGEHMECYLRIDDTTMYETYAPDVKVSAKTYRAGGALEFTMNVIETVEYERLGKLTESRLRMSHMDMGPRAPRDACATVRGGTWFVTWREPVWDGGIYRITGYEIQHKPQTDADWKDDHMSQTWTSDDYWEARRGSVGVEADDDSDTALVVTYTMDLGDGFDTGLTDDGKYDFRVRAVNKAGSSPWTEAGEWISPEDSG